MSPGVVWVSHVGESRGRVTWVSHVGESRGRVRWASQVGENFLDSFNYQKHSKWSGF